MTGLRHSAHGSRRGGDGGFRSASAVSAIQSGTLSGAAGFGAADQLPIKTGMIVKTRTR